MKVQQKNFGEIGEIIKEKLNHLERNRVENAYRALPMWLDTNWNRHICTSFCVNIGKSFLKTETYEYLNDNFGYGPYGNVSKFNVVVVESNDVYDRDPNLFYYSKGDNTQSVVVGLGKIWPKYRCDQQTDNGVKKLTCFKIGDRVISYIGEVGRVSLPASRRVIFD